MNYKLCVIGLLLLSLSIAVADNVTTDDIMPISVEVEQELANEYCEFIFTETQLEVGVQLDSKLMYKNEVFRAIGGGEVVGHIVIEDYVVTQMGCDDIADPTYIVYIENVDTLRTINDAEQRLSALNQAIKQDSLKLEGQSMGKSIKGFFTRNIIRIGSWFE